MTNDFLEPREANLAEALAEMQIKANELRHELDVARLYADRAYGALRRVLDVVAEYRDDAGPNATVPAGAVLAAVYISNDPPTEDDIKRGREIEALLKKD